MLRRLVFLSGGTLALLVALAAPGQLHAQPMGGGAAPGMHPGFSTRAMPGFRGGSNPRFSRGFFNRRFDPRFNGRRFDRFEDRFENRFPFGRFDRFEDRFENRFNRGFFAFPFGPRIFPGVVFPF